MKYAIVNGVKTNIRDVEKEQLVSIVGIEIIKLKPVKVIICSIGSI